MSNDLDENKDVSLTSPTKKRGEIAIYPDKKKIQVINRENFEIPERKRARDTYGACISCPVQDVCDKAFEEKTTQNFTDVECSCFYKRNKQMRELKKMFNSYRAFCSTEPKDMLRKIYMTYDKLEQLAMEDPSYTKLTNLIYLMINVYKLKFGDKVFVAQVNKTMNAGNNPTVDVKEAMKTVRSEWDKLQKEKQTITATVGVGGGVLSSGAEDNSIVIDDDSNIELNPDSEVGGGRKKGEEGGQNKEILPTSEKISKKEGEKSEDEESVDSEQ